MAEGEKELNRQTLDSLETDAIGEILNISMGAAATAISTMVDRKVDITTPVVAEIKAENFECGSLEPAIGIEIEYVDGLTGSNIMVMRKRDIRAIVNLLLGEETEVNSTDDLDEMHLSAASEIMNQMMGASSTALATFLGKPINISPPKHFNMADIQKKIARPAFDDTIVTVKFILNIENILNSEFVTVMPMEFTKALVLNAMNFDEPEEQPVKDMQPEVNEKARPAAEPVPDAKPRVPADSAEYVNNSRPAQAPANPQPKRTEARPSAAYAHAAAQPVQVRAVQLPNFDEMPTAVRAAEDSNNFGIVMGVPLEISVEIGKTKMSVKEILDIRQGSLIELDRQAGDPVDIMVNGRLIARGDVVIIDDDFGVRVTEILSDRNCMPD